MADHPAGGLLTTMALTPAGPTGDEVASCSASQMAGYGQSGPPKVTAAVDSSMALLQASALIDHHRAAGYQVPQSTIGSFSSCMNIAFPPAAHPYQQSNGQNQSDPPQAPMPQALGLITPEYLDSLSHSCHFKTPTTVARLKRNIDLITGDHELMNELRVATSQRKRRKWFASANRVLKEQKRRHQLAQRRAERPRRTFTALSELDVPWTDRELRTYYQKFKDMYANANPSPEKYDQIAPAIINALNNSVPPLLPGRTIERAATIINEMLGHRRLFLRCTLALLKERPGKETVSNSKLVEDLDANQLAPFAEKNEKEQAVITEKLGANVFLWDVFCAVYDIEHIKRSCAPEHFQELLDDGDSSDSAAPPRSISNHHYDSSSTLNQHHDSIVDSYADTLPPSAAAPPTWPTDASASVLQPNAPVLQSTLPLAQSNANLLQSSAAPILQSIASSLAQARQQSSAPTTGSSMDSSALAAAISQQSSQVMNYLSEQNQAFQMSGGLSCFSAYSVCGYYLGVSIHLWVMSIA